MDFTPQPSDPSRPELLLEPGGRWADLQNGVRVGQAFAFFAPELPAGSSLSWLSQLLPSDRRVRRVFSLLGNEPTALPGALHLPVRLPEVQLTCVTSDKPLYHEAAEPVRLLLLDLTQTAPERRLKLSLNGQDWASHTLTLGQHGAATLELHDLPCGEYAATLEGVGGTPCQFQVAQYRLAPLVGQFVERALEGTSFRFTIRLESFGQPVEGEVTVDLTQRGRRLDGRTLACGEGLLMGEFPLVGEGPFALNLQLAQDATRTATLPILGSRQEERELSLLSSLGQQVHASLMPLHEDEPVRGLYLETGGSSNSPIWLERVDARRGRLHVRAAMGPGLVEVVDPSFLQRVSAQAEPHPGRTDEAYRQAEALFREERYSQARQKFQERWRALKSPHPYYAYNIACSLALEGQREEAVRWLRQALREGYWEVEHMQNDEDLLCLRDFPAFQELFSLGRQTLSFEQLQPGDTLEFDVPDPMAILAVGAFLEDSPWEGWAVMVTPPQLQPQLCLPEHTRAGRPLEIRVEGCGNGAVHLLVKDARLQSTDTPLTLLAARLKGTSEDASKTLHFGPVTRKLSEFTPPSPFAQPTRSHGSSLSHSPEMSSYADPFATPPDLYGAGAFESMPMMEPPQAFAASDPFSSAADPFASAADPFAAPPSHRPQRAGLVRRGSPPAAPPSARPMLSRAPVADSPVTAGARPRMGSSPGQAAPASTRAAVAQNQVEAPVRPAPLVREAPKQEPQVYYAGLLEVTDGVAMHTLTLPELAEDVMVEAFVWQGKDWIHQQSRVRVVADPWVSLEVPPYASLGDAVRGMVRGGAREGPARLCVWRNEEVLLELEGEGRLSETFAIVPGHYRVLVENLATGERLERERTVEQPGSYRRMAKTIRFLRRGERVEVTGDVTQLRVLPCLKHKLVALATATQHYEHSCCEQAASKLVGAMCRYASTEGDERREAEASIVTGLAYQRTMWLRGRGFKSYPNYANDPNTHWGPMAARHLWNLYSLRSLPMSPGLRQAVQSAWEMVEDVSRAYQLQFPPNRISNLVDAYWVAKRAPERIQEVMSWLSPQLRGWKEWFQGSHKVQARTDASYCAAVLLAANTELDLALQMADRVLADLNSKGRLYSTQDSQAALILLNELNAARIGTGLARLRVNGEEGPAVGEVRTLEVLEGVAAVEVSQWQIEDWSRFRSTVPLVVNLERQKRSSWKVRPGDGVELVVRLESAYEFGDLVWICLPEALSRVVGGAQVKLFSVDFAGERELRIPLAVTAAETGQQSLYVCVRNMYKEDRAGSPGPLPVTVV